MSAASAVRRARQPPRSAGAVLLRNLRDMPADDPRGLIARHAAGCPFERLQSVGEGGIYCGWEIFVYGVGRVMRLPRSGDLEVDAHPVHVSLRMMPVLRCYPHLAFGQGRPQRLQGRNMAADLLLGGRRARKVFEAGRYPANHHTLPQRHEEYFVRHSLS